MGLPYKVALRKNETGEVRLASVGVPWDNGSFFWWTEGNMSCDCNREIFFERAGGNGGDIDAPCSDGRYTALHAELSDGTQIKLDEDAIDAAPASIG